MKAPSTSLNNAAIFSAGVLTGAACLALLQHYRLRKALSSKKQANPLDPEEIRYSAAAAAELIVQYKKDLAVNGKGKYSVRSEILPGDLIKRLPSSCPEKAESWDEIFQDLQELILPACTHWSSPNFYAYFKCFGSEPNAIGEFISATLNTVGFSWVGSPATTELEQVVADWMSKLVGLPDCFRFSSNGSGGGMIQGTASESLLCSMIAARELALRGLSEKEKNEKVSKLCIYISDQTHSIAEKNCIVLGMRLLRVIKTCKGDVDDRNYGLNPEDLEEAIQQDLSKGLIPFLVIPTVGTTSTTAIDPVEKIVHVARAQKHYMWVHLDGAYGGSAMICPEYQKWWKGVELCDSVCLNPHKWLMISMDCSLLWVRNRMHLIDALAQHPEYLKNEHMHQVNYKDWQVPLGRRFRALKLWFVLRRFGAEGLRQHIRRSIKLAQHAHQLLKEDGRFEMFVPTRMGLVCFYLKKGGRQANEELLKRVNDSGKIFLIHSVVDGQHFLRLSVGGLEIEESNVQFAIQVLQETLDEIEKNATIKKIKN